MCQEIETLTWVISHKNDLSQTLEPVRKVQEHPAAQWVIKCLLSFHVFKQSSLSVLTASLLAKNGEEKQVERCLWELNRHQTNLCILLGGGPWTLKVLEIT